MDLAAVGRNFHSLMLDMGENYTLTTPDGEEYTGKISLIAKTASTYMLAEREYLMTGAATFPSMEAQTTFRGCYFHRQINPERTYIMASVIPKDTTELVADVYAVECNTAVSLAYCREKTENYNTFTVPEVYEENVLVYWDSTLQKQRRSSDGNFDQTLYYMQIPARYSLAQDEIVLRKMYQFNEQTEKNEWTDVRFRVESVDSAMIKADNEGNIYGIMDVQMSLDTRT